MKFILVAVISIILFSANVYSQKDFNTLPNNKYKYTKVLLDDGSVILCKEMIKVSDSTISLQSMLNKSFETYNITEINNVQIKRSNAGLGGLIGLVAGGAIAFTVDNSLPKQLLIVGVLTVFGGLSGELLSNWQVYKVNK